MPPMRQTARHQETGARERPPVVSLRDQTEERGQHAIRLDPGPSRPTPELDVEGALAGVLADVLGVERLPVDSHFFDDLGADSMVMARFCARVRKRSDLPAVSMKDVYRHPTIRSLATALADDVPVP